MQEYGGEAIVLRREAQGEADSRVSLFMKRFGKLAAKAKSARKITSKLSAHLEPGSVTEIRLVEKNDLHVVDALKKTRLAISPKDLYLLDRVLGEGDPDPALWHMVRDGQFSWEHVLAFLGWDPREASCSSCGGFSEVFHVARHDFFCGSCAARTPREQLIIINQ